MTADGRKFCGRRSFVQLRCYCGRTQFITVIALDVYSDRANDIFLLVIKIQCVATAKSTTKDAANAFRYAYTGLSCGRRIIIIVPSSFACIIHSPTNPWRSRSAVLLRAACGIPAYMWDSVTDVSLRGVMILC